LIQHSFQRAEYIIKFNRSVDLTQLFDIVRLKNIIAMLKKQLNQYHSISINNQIYIKAEKKLMSRISTATNVNQRNSLSPIFFNLIMDKIDNVTTSDKEYKIKKEQIKIVCYADDVIIISENEDDII